MISVIITSFKEPKTIQKAISSIAEQNISKNEIIVIAPDDETLNAARRLKKKYSTLRVLRDSGNGKPAALNIAVKKAKGDILVLTDGDVFVGKSSITSLVDLFKDKKIGAVSGNPVSLDMSNNMFGFWGHLLTSIAHDRRVEAIKKKKRLFCSGYLFAIRKELFPKLDPGLLSEDGFISHKVYEKGYEIGYAPTAKVYVKYPDNFEDWIKQKRRSAGGYKQLKEEEDVEIRSFRKESFGAFGFFRHISGFKELIWLACLFMARVYLWYRINEDVNMDKKSHKEIWKRIESTK